jgi:superfamily II DNA or RNA helicase
VLDLDAPSLAALRPWQRRALGELEGWSEGSFLLSAAPGAGKTRPALLLARALRRRREAGTIVVACPTAPLTRQWAEAAARLGLQLLPDAEALPPPPGFDGVAITYARIASSADAYRRACRPGTLVVADEAHHLGDELAWGQGFLAAFGPAVRWLLLSGTPFRSDGAPIPGVRYDADGVAVPDFSLSYAEAIAEGICRRVGFVPYDGRLQWRSGGEVVESSFADALDGREAGRRYRTAISTELPDGLPRILRAAHERLEAVRAGGHRDAGALAVTADARHASAVAAVLREITGEAPTVVLHTDPRAAEALRRFTSTSQRWLVAVNMVSEGVDIPRLRVGVYATAAKTPLIFRQIVGRFVRTGSGDPSAPAHLFLPADPVLRRMAAEVEDELRPILAQPGEEGDEAVEERRREARETVAPAEFVPVSADVVPQLALFGEVAETPPVALSGPSPPPSPPVAAEPAFGPAPVPAPPADAGPAPAFLRRETLRRERHRLVADLRRRGGGSHVELNAWLNRSTGIASVERATVEQLERSVVLLRRELGLPTHPMRGEPAPLAGRR